MKRMSLGTILIFALVTSMLAQPLRADEEAEKAAVKVAEEWLALIDEGEYKKSWEEAAVLAKTAVEVDQWGHTIRNARMPFGALKSRKVKSAEYTTSLPGAPDGHYVVVQFDTSFEHKAAAIETVTPMKDPDGVWRVSGYFIK